MKKLLLIVICCFFILSCDNPERKSKYSPEKTKKVVEMFKSKYPEDNFYFIQGLDYKLDLNTNIRYRGILYSDRLEKLGYPFGMNIALEENDDGWGYLKDYEAFFLKIEVDKPIEEKMKEVFGELSVLYNHYGVSINGYKEFLADIGKDLPFDKKGRADYTVVNLFVDKLEDIDKEEIKKKTYEFAKFLYDDMNLKTYLQVYIRDNSFFENYNLVAYQVYPPFRNRKDIKIILDKIKNKEEISEEEKIILVNVFYKDIEFNNRHTSIKIIFNSQKLKKYNEQKFHGDLLREDYIEKGWN